MNEWISGSPAGASTASHQRSRLRPASERRSARAFGGGGLKRFLHAWLKAISKAMVAGRILNQWECGFF